MRTGISINRGMNDYFPDERLVSEFAAMGFDCVDYGFFHTESDAICGHVPEIYLPDSEFEAYFKAKRQMIEKNGMTVSQTHACFAIDDIPEMGVSTQMLLGLKRCIMATALLGAKYLVVHPVKRPYNERANEAFDLTVNTYKALIPTLEKYDVYVACENLFGRDDLKRPVPCNCSYPDQLISIIEATGSDRFVSCLDTGHMLLCGGDCACAVRDLGDRLKVLHVHDNDKINDRHAMPMDGNGEIEIDWPAFITALKETGFDGVFSLEVDGMIFRAAAVYPELMFDYCRIAKKVVDRLLEV